MAYVLFKLYEENPFYRKNSRGESVNLEAVSEYNKYSLKIIEQELPKYHRQQTMLHPVFQSTIAESLILENVSNKLDVLLSVASNMPIETRVIMWTALNQAIDTTLINSYLEQMNLKGAIEKETGELYENQIYGEFEHTSLDKLIAQTLKKKMDISFRKDRDKIGELYSKAQKELDKKYIKHSGDTGEGINKIGKMFEEYDFEEAVTKINDYEVESQINIM